MCPIINRHTATSISVFQDAVFFPLISISFTLTPPPSGKHLSLSPPLLLHPPPYCYNKNTKKERKLYGYTFHTLLAAVGGTTSRD
jgi:hypothetical protein